MSVDRKYAAMFQDTHSYYHLVSHFLELKPQHLKAQIKRKGIKVSMRTKAMLEVVLWG